MQKIASQKCDVHEEHRHIPIDNSGGYVQLRSREKRAAVVIIAGIKKNDSARARG